MEITIYIDVYYTGNLRKGTGSYDIMLEYITPDGPKTREHYEEFKNTTKYRTAIKACIEALGHITKACDVKIIINSQFVVNSINQNWDKSKNADLWQQLLTAMSVHKVEFEYSLSNPYSTYMFLAAKRAEVTCKEDTGNEDNLQQRGS
jgi:ribonuclease HI